MKQLSALDASFLYLESPEMPMHVGALHVFELPPGFDGRFVDALRVHLASRLPLAPALRRKLAWMPLNLSNPAWVDAEPDLDWHVRGVKLPRGADLDALHAQIGELHPQLLDRDRPLWQFFVFEGLKAGPRRSRRAAMYTKLHHAAVDGQAAVALANAIFDTTPQPRTLEPREPRAKKFRLGLAEMVGGSVANQLQQLAGIVRGLPSTIGTLGAAARSALAAESRSALATLSLAPRTRFNASVMSTRAFACVTLPLAELKAAAKRHGGTVNDAVLFVCGGALRRWLKRHDPLPRKSLVAAVPVSLRAAGDASASNQVSITLISLGTHLADPQARLAHVLAASTAMKRAVGSVKSVLPTDLPSIGVGWLLGAAARLYKSAKVAERLPPIANVAISNVPGAPFPLYLVGARMLANYPTSIVVHGLALNITVQSYDQSMDFGLVACARACPQLLELADDLRSAFDEFVALEPAQPTTTAPVAQATGRRKAPTSARARRTR